MRHLITQTQIDVHATDGAAGANVGIREHQLFLTRVYEIRQTMKTIKTITLLSCFLFTFVSCHSSSQDQTKTITEGVVLSIPSEGFEFQVPDSSWQVISMAALWSMSNTQLNAEITSQNIAGTLEDAVRNKIEMQKQFPGFHASNNNEKIVLDGNVPALVNSYELPQVAYREINFDHNGKRYIWNMHTSPEIGFAGDLKKDVDFLLKNLKLFPSTQQDPSIKNSAWGLEFVFPNTRWNINSTKNAIDFTQSTYQQEAPYNLVSLCQVSVSEVSSNGYSSLKQTGSFEKQITKTPVQSKSEITIGNDTPATVITYEPLVPEPQTPYDIPARQTVLFEHNKKFYRIMIQVKDETFYASLKNDVDFILKNMKVF